MSYTNTKESGLESLIVRWLVEHNGYEQGHSHDYNVEYAVDTVRLFRFLKDTQPDAVRKLQLETSPQKTAQFLARVRDEITKRGIVDVLRRGIKAYPASLVMFYMTPSVNNPRRGSAVCEEHLQRHAPAPFLTRRHEAVAGPVHLHQRPAGHHLRAEKPANQAECGRCGLSVPA